MSGPRGRARRAGALALGAALLLAGCGRALSPGESHAPGAPSDPVGTTTWSAADRPAAVGLSGTTLDGGPLDLAALRGHVVVLNAWASWCAPCRTESPALARVAAATAGSGVRFVGLDEQDEPAAARAFAAQAGVTYPIVEDPQGVLLARLRLVPAAAIPSTLVLAPDGRVAARVVGAVDEAGLTALVAAAGAAAASGSPGPS